MATTSRNFFLGLRQLAALHGRFAGFKSLTARPGLRRCDPNRNQDSWKLSARSSTYDVSSVRKSGDRLEFSAPEIRQEKRQRALRNFVPVTIFPAPELLNVENTAPDKRDPPLIESSL